MGRRNLFQRLFNGDVLPDEQIEALSALAVPSAQVDYLTLKQVIGPMNKAIITLDELPVTVANTTGASFGSKQLLDFPTGRIKIEGGTANLSFDWSDTDIGLTGSGDFSVGTTATADATLSSTDVDLIASSAMLDPFVSGVGTGTGNFVKGTEFDGTATAKDAYLNLIIDDADVSDAASDIVLVSGTLILMWQFLGDY